MVAFAVLISHMNVSSKTAMGSQHLLEVVAVAGPQLGGRPCVTSARVVAEDITSRLVLDEREHTRGGDVLFNHATDW